jgi:hypothetical protein
VGRVDHQLNRYQLLDQVTLRGERVNSQREDQRGEDRQQGHW